MVDISIIIVNWNTKKITSDCIESIYKTAGNMNIEIIVVDNASSDGSAEYLSSKFDEIILIRNKANYGFSKANNIGIERSAGKYICLVNSDVVVHENCLQSLFQFMEENGDVGIAHPKILNSDGSLQLTCREFPDLWNYFIRAMALDTIFPKSNLFGKKFMSYWDHNSIQNVDYVSGCFMFVRRNALKNIGLLDEDYFFYAEDKDWCKRFWDYGWKVTYYPHCTSTHLLYGSSSDKPVKYYIEEMRSNIIYWNKNHNKKEARIFRWLLVLHQIVRMFFEPILYLSKKRSVISFNNNIKRSFKGLRWLLSSNN